MAVDLDHLAEIAGGDAPGMSDRDAEMAQHVIDQQSGEQAQRDGARAECRDPGGGAGDHLLDMIDRGIGLGLGGLHIGVN